jgi:hypothetical protein
MFTCLHEISCDENLLTAGQLIHNSFLNLTDGCLLAISYQIKPYISTSLLQTSSNPEEKSNRNCYFQNIIICIQLGWSRNISWAKFCEIFAKYLVRISRNSPTKFVQFRKVKFRFFWRNLAFFVKFFLFQKISINIFQDVTPVFQINTYFVKHRNGHAARVGTCNVDMYRQHVQWTCTMDMDMCLGHGHAPWTVGCSDF